jgi:hypothetical protein
VVAQALEDLIAVELRHHDVEQHHVERRCRQALECLASVHGRRHRVPLALEPPHEQVAVGLVVVDDQDVARTGVAHD